MRLPELLKRPLTWGATLTMLVMGVPSMALAQSSEDVEVYRAQLTGLNNSSASGEAIVSREGDQLTVIIYAEGLETGQAHPQHIHGFDDDRNATCPTLEQDDDGDNLVQVAEGRDTYGPIQLELMPFPVGQSNPDNEAGSTATPPRGDVTYVNTFTIGPNGDVSEDAVTPFPSKHIVLHGMTVDGAYQATLPAACGQLVELPQPDGDQNRDADGPDDNGNDFNGGGDGGCSLWDGQGAAPGFDPLWALLLLAALTGIARIRQRRQG
ncbi:MAG: hypothetical protein RJQ08_14600 [Salinisphaeraceae bacterium]|uniref:CHRD domain-containing protein n=1 Tax=Spectribacter hydrogenoxidans TaxID=3075608 RepID=A0ABU3C2Z8_9GAMM|nr:hypothetical protein [Salinisphaera sp. W335]MDT0635928.1 hypothetical protein [Salinisphaera sp. W335]